jgi:hypothetical protein
MSIDYAAVLAANYPGAQWTLNGDTYDGLTWLDDTPKPTQVELDSLWDSTVAMIEQEKLDKAAARQALLDRLGITEDEARMLLG